MCSLEVDRSLPRQLQQRRSDMACWVNPERRKTTQAQVRRWNQVRVVRCKKPKCSSSSVAPQRVSNLSLDQLHTFSFLQDFPQLGLRLQLSQGLLQPQLPLPTSHLRPTSLLRFYHHTPTSSRIPFLPPIPFLRVCNLRSSKRTLTLTQPICIFHPRPLPFNRQPRFLATS